MDTATPKGADTELGALHVGQNPDRPVEAILQFADHGEAGGVVVVRAVREVQAEDVCARLEQAGKDIGGGAGRAKRRNNLRAAPAAQLGAGRHSGSFISGRSSVAGFQAIRIARMSLTLVSV